MQTRAVLATLLVAVALLAGATSGAAGASGGSGGSDITQTTTLSLTPDAPGSVSATVSYDLPDNVTALTVTVPSSDRVTGANGFSRVSGDSYRWDGDTAAPSITLRESANRTFTGARALADRGVAGNGTATANATTIPPSTNAAVSTDTGYSFVDAGSWAIVPVPQFGSHWSWRGGGHVGLSRKTAVNGSGVAGSAMAYLGPYEEYDRRAHGQTFRLIVPAAAAKSMTESPNAVLSSLAEASGLLTVGQRDAVVREFAAPTTVNWGPAGLEYGGSDAWVRADSRLDAPEDVWLHEYVHTRQSYDASNATRWTTEATAEYYAGLLSLEEGNVTYDAFRRYLSRGGDAPYASAVLSDPETWRGPANYLKGALVVATLDRRIRLDSNRTRTFADVLAQMNADRGSVSRAEFLAAVAAAGGSDARNAAERYAGSSDAPRTFSDAAYRRAFGTTPPRLAYSFPSDAFAVRGPWRNASVLPGATLAVGETLAVNATVRNGGSDDGVYAATLYRNRSVVAATNGTVRSGGTAAVALTEPLDAPGNYTLVAGDHRLSVRVVRPAATTVQNVTVSPRSVNASAPVTVSVTAANPTSRPANGTYALTVDGTRRGSWSPHLPANATATGTFTLTFASGGTHTVTVGNESATVRVTGGSSTLPSLPDGSSVPSPGFGPLVALVGALAALGFVARRRGGRRD